MQTNNGLSKEEILTSTKDQYHYSQMVGKEDILHGYPNANWAGDKDTQHLTSGY